MKFLIPVLPIILFLTPIITKAQFSCEHGGEPDSCSAVIPNDAIVVMGTQMYSNSTMTCYWVCPGDTLILHSSFNCNIYLEPLARLELGGSNNYVWAKSESKVEILAGSFSNTLGILEDVIFVDDGTNTMETICWNGISFSYIHIPVDGCDLTMSTKGPEMTTARFYPNPVSGKGSIFVETEPGIFGDVILSDRYGRMLRTWKAAGERSLELPLEATAPGIYFIQVPQQGWIKKIVIFEIFRFWRLIR
jgi:hypothetical protein